jgi:hypothetical protein
MLLSNGDADRLSLYPRRSSLGLYFLSSLAAALNMVRTASFRVSSGLVYLILPLAAAGIIFLLVGPVAAQSVGEREQLFQRETQDRSSEQSPSGARGDRVRPSAPSSNLPDWASPAQPPSQQGPSSVNRGVRTKAAPPPPERDQVPVDGGLALLAAAGAGYAVRKLKDSEDDEGEGELP